MHTLVPDACRCIHSEKVNAKIEQKEKDAVDIRKNVGAEVELAVRSEGTD